MPDRLAEARKHYTEALRYLTLADDRGQPSTSQWADPYWAAAQWHLMRAQALEGLARLEARDDITKLRQRVDEWHQGQRWDSGDIRRPEDAACPAHGPHPHHGLICLDCPQCATGTAATRDV